jgi:hypothetical protein
MDPLVKGGRQETIQNRRAIEAVMIRLLIRAFTLLSENVMLEQVRDHCFGGRPR